MKKPKDIEIAKKLAAIKLGPLGGSVVSSLPLVAAEAALWRAAKVGWLDQSAPAPTLQQN